MNPRQHLREAGFGLVELMIALVLGMIVVIGALSLFASNRQASRTTEGLSRVQENARIGFELMARDVRDAGGTPCSKNIPMGNVITGAAGNWIYDWGNGLQGFAAGDALSGLPASGIGARVAGTDALVVHSGGSDGVSVTDHDTTTSAQFKVNTKDHGFVDGDIAVVCDYRQATIVQITNASSSNETLVHNTSGLNCTKGLGLPIDCSSTNGNPYKYGANSVITRLTSAAWYIGNGASGPALFRKFVNRAPDEIAANVRSMELRYLVRDAAAYVTAGAVTAAGAWPNVTAVQIRFVTESPERVSTTGTTLDRPVLHYAALRNRNP